MSSYLGESFGKVEDECSRTSLAVEQDIFTKRYSKSILHLPDIRGNSLLISRFKYVSLSIPAVNVAISLSIPSFNESIIGGRDGRGGAQSWKIGQEQITCSIDSMH